MKKFSRALSLIIALLMCLTVVLVACDKDVKITLDKTEESLVIGGSVTLTATASDGSTVSFTSNKPEIATVSATGVVTGVSQGNAVITAKSGTATATCAITVTGDGIADQDGQYITVADYRAYMIYDLKAVQTTIGSISEEIDANVSNAMYVGIANINKAHTIADVKTAFTNAKAAMANCIPLANGVKSYSAASMEDKTDILGLLEGYAIRNGISGIGLFENGGHQMFSDRIVLGTENYILGYGFGTLAEGNITADMANENNTAWKRYYHTYMATNTNTVNEWDSNDSNVTTMGSYIDAGYYTNFMNETHDGYDWIPELAATQMEAVGGLDAKGQADTWRFEIRSGLKYDTLGKHTEYKGLAVQPEDFLTPYKLMFNQANGLFRGEEASKQTGAQAIVGAADYYAATKDANKGIATTGDFSKVGVKVYEEGGKWYFQIQIGEKVTPFYARYYTTSSLYMPIPASFIEAIGGIENYRGFNTNKSDSPVDNSLSLGPYTLERWDDGQVVYKKNPYYVYADTKYAIEGIHINILTAAATDNEAGFREFLQGNIDASGIPQAYLSQYISDPRTRATLGDFCYKLNVNALDAETWEYMFGEEGVITQTPKSQYWQVNPLMSNDHFIMGLSYALNRKEFADARGYVASANFFSSDYMSDPEKGTSYDATEQHKQALSSIVNEDTDDYGYSLELARDYFRMALEEVEAAGLLTPGTAANPTVISLQCIFYFASFEEPIFKPIKQYWEEAFNHSSVSGGKYKIEFVFYAPSTTDIAYDNMMAGQFDFGFGGITGNPLNPLDFISTLSSDPIVSQGWTLNWGLNTGDATADILVYDGMRWSFDALQQASQTTVVVSNGNLGLLIEQGDTAVTEQGDDLNVTLTLEYNTDLDLEIDIDDLVLFYQLGNNYDEWSIMELNPIVTDDGEGTITITFVLPASEIAKVDGADYSGVDVYYVYTVEGSEGEGLYSYEIFE
ncbi:MAG: Ig-like domain-containing protein [Firmicutes bacterium]|nr:Ig-like domain-containing protein [Bacillota bacterium]